MSKNAIQINDLCFSYGTKSVLENVSITIPANRICFIMGNNGSGKTTLLKNIMGFLSPQSGTIRIQGENSLSLDYKVMSRMISYVPQAIGLSTDFSVIDYLSLGRTPHMQWMSKLSDLDYQIIEAFAEKLGIVELFDATFNNLSGGQKQMVAIARSLIQDTPIVILDEPMSALDIGKQVDLLKILCEQTLQGKTIILTTHNPNHALAVESDSCFIKEGKVAAIGRSDDIIQNDLLYEVYGSNITLDQGNGSKSVVFNTDSIKKQQLTEIQRILIEQQEV